MTMITKIQLHKKATVLAADGKQLGSLERVVLNPKNNVITDVVVRTGALTNREEKVVPIALVDETADDQILLREEAGDLEAFPQFEEQRIVNEHGGMNKSSSPTNDIPTAVDNIAVGAPLLQTSSEQIVTRIEQNIPEGTVAMKEGAKVIAADGKQIGNVERVLAEPQMEQITHLLVSSGWFNKQNKLIPVAWVMRMGEDTVHLRVGKDWVEDLAAAPLAG
jgi:sporulation protein YlmC with PRC-barrel domain